MSNQAAPITRAQDLAEYEASYLKLLQTLKKSDGRELGVVRRLAAWIASPRVLNQICLHRAWYEDWEVKEALVRNEHTPLRFRQDLETKIAIFDLMREMDRPGIPAREKTEIGDNIKHLLRTLSAFDRAAVKKRAYELSASRRSGAASANQSAAAPPVALVSEPDLMPPAAPETGEDYLADLLAEGEAKLAEQEAWLARHKRQLEELEAGLPKEGIGLDPTPEDDAEENGNFDLTLDLPVPTSELEPDFMLSPEEEILVDEDVLLETVAQTSEPPNEEALAETAGIPSGEAPDEASVKTPAQVDEEKTYPPKEEIRNVPTSKLEIAQSSSDPKELAALIHEFEEIQLALVANPNLDDRAASLMARKAGARVIAAIQRQPRYFSRPMVRAALLDSPHTSAAALLEIVNTLGDPTGLLRLIKNPKIRYMEVKAKARARLATVFKSMTTGEKVAVIRRTGRLLLKELWTDFFRDEALVLQCLRERQLDTGIIMEISRSRIAPRYALELIGKTRAFSANQAVCMALVQNPKTPRATVSHLIPRLNPNNRRMLRNNPRMPDYVRRVV